MKTIKKCFVSIADPCTEPAELTSTINHQWTKSIQASPDGERLNLGLDSNGNITKNSVAVEYKRAAILEVDVARARPGCPFRQESCLHGRFILLQNQAHRKAVSTIGLPRSETRFRKSHIAFDAGQMALPIGCVSGSL